MVHIVFSFQTVSSALVHIYNTKGFYSLWHGVSAGILKSVPKYITAIVIKDFMEDRLPRGDSKDKNFQLTRSAVKSVVAGIAGAVLTNPLDVIRNEMFKTDFPLVKTFRTTLEKEGWSFATRGMASNVCAVSIPLAITIFLTDVLQSMKIENE